MTESPNPTRKARELVSARRLLTEEIDKAAKALARAVGHYGHLADEQSAILAEAGESADCGASTDRVQAAVAFAFRHLPTPYQRADLLGLDEVSDPAPLRENDNAPDIASAGQAGGLDHHRAAA